MYFFVQYYTIIILFVSSPTLFPDVLQCCEAHIGWKNATENAHFRKWVYILLLGGVCLYYTCSLCRQLGGRAPEVHQSWPASSSVWWDQMWAWSMVLWSCECDCPIMFYSRVYTLSTCVCVAQPWLWRTSWVLSDQSDRDWERGDGQGGGGERGVTQSQDRCNRCGEHSKMGSGLVRLWHRLWSIPQDRSWEWENSETGNGMLLHYNSKYRILKCVFCVYTDVLLLSLDYPPHTHTQHPLTRKDSHIVPEVGTCVCDTIGACKWRPQN